MIRLSDECIEKLICEAQKARENAYAPYSGYKVGAALLAGDMIFGGCNVENASYPASNCAERTAIFKAVSEGCKSFDAIAIVGGTDEKADFAAPCGICRQTMREFSDPEKFCVIIAKDKNEYKMMSLSELLPESFGPDNLR